MLSIKKSGEKKGVADVRWALAVLGAIFIASFGVAIWAGYEGSVWLFVASLGPIFSSGLAILRVLASPRWANSGRL